MKIHPLIPATIFMLSLAKLAAEHPGPLGMGLWVCFFVIGWMIAAWEITVRQRFEMLTACHDSDDFLTVMAVPIFRHALAVFCLTNPYALYRPAPKRPSVK